MMIAKTTLLALAAAATAAHIVAAEPAPSAAAITYQLDRAEQVSLAVYDQAGCLVRTLASAEPQTAGAHALTWDGLDRNGVPLPAGSYPWRLLKSAGLQAEFMLAVGTNPEWPAYQEWIGNHDEPRTVAVDAQGNVYAGAGSGEGTDVLLKMSPDWKQKLWAVTQLQVADGADRLALIGDTLFVLEKNRRVFALDAKTGAKRQGDKPFYDPIHPKDTRWEWGMDNSIKTHVSPMDMEAVGGLLAFSYWDHGIVRLVSATDATVVREVKIDRPGGLAAGPNQTLFIAAEGRILALAAGQDRTSVVVDDVALTTPVGLTYEPVSGDLIVALNGTGQHLRRYHDGKLVTTLGRAAGRQWGQYQASDFHGLFDVQADGKGGFFTIEAVPRRIAHFSATKTTPDREWFGSVHWGAMLCQDPADPTIAYFEFEFGQFMRAKLDLTTRRWALTHVYERLAYPQPLEVGLRWRVMHRGGQTYLVNFGDHSTRYAPFVIKLVDGGNRLQMASFLARMSNEQLDWWAAAVKRDGRGNGSGAIAWTDRNGDGQIQSDEASPAAQGLGSGHVWIDDDWTVFVAASAQRELPIDANGRATMWYRIPNRATGPEQTPSWDWQDAVAVKAQVPDEFRRWQFPELVGIGLDGQGNVYQMTRPSYRVGTTREERDDQEERHGDGWPHNYSAICRIFKWRPDGALEWAIGKKACEKRHERPGELTCPVSFLGFAKDRFFIHDRAGRVMTAWTTDGLAAGYVFDRHADDGLPADTLYRVTGDVSPRNFLMGDDHVIQNWVMANDGQMYWSTPGQDATTIYRIHDWAAGTRQTGTVTLRAPAASAPATGTGLSASYFASPDLSGSPLLERIDNHIWFRGLYLAFCGEIKARKFFAENSLLPERTFAARWSGTVTPRFSEDYRFVIYTDHEGTAPVGGKVRLWLADKLVVDRWDSIAPRTGNPESGSFSSAPIPLTAGQRVPLRLEFSANGSQVPHLHLCWDSRTQDREHIPASALHPAR